ncbi:MAG: hypothetical protein KatS3mg040_0207 [Candidatus Kapaibacterium sp.]|nr:MAG: hypothetical protein KatS3mg040_0207 [Candidatus Kapabacteria bacterium]
MKSSTYHALLFSLLSACVNAQNLFIPTKVINEAFGITTPKPAYYVHTGLTDESSFYFSAIGDYTNTRLNYDSLGFYSAVWQFRLSDNQWFAIDRLNGFPSTARWTEGANFTPLYFSDRDATVPLFLWALGNHVLTYNPDNRRSTWRTLELPADPPERRHDGFFSLGTIRLPLTSSNAVLFSSSFMLLEDPRSPSGKSMDPWVDIYTGSVTEDSLHLLSSIPRTLSWPLPITFNPAIGPDSAWYSLSYIPISIGSPPYPLKPIKLLRYDPATNSVQLLSPRSGLSQVESLQGAYVWSHDSCIYAFCMPQVLISEIPKGGDTSVTMAVLRYNVYTGHCERVLAIGSREDGFSASFGAGMTGTYRYVTPYKNGIAVLGSERSAGDAHTTVYILQHTDAGQLTLDRIMLKDLFPSIQSTGREFPMSISAWGDRFIVATTGGLYILESPKSSVSPPSLSPDAMVYPLPARKGQTVYCTLPSSEIPATIARVDIYQSSGKRIPLQLDWNSTTVIIPTTSLASGTYWLVVVTDRGTRLIHPLVIE